MHTSTDKRNANHAQARTPGPEHTDTRETGFGFVDNRVQPDLIRQLRGSDDDGLAGATSTVRSWGANRNAHARRVTQVQSMADGHSAGQINPVVQKKLGGGDIVSLNALNGNHDFAALSPEERWTILNGWVQTRTRAKDPPTIQEAAGHLGVAVAQPAPTAKVESSDIHEDYDVRKGCALQALIVFCDYDVLGQSSAEALHDHIWATDELTAYRNYDVDWAKLYAHVGITLNEDYKDTKVDELPIGVYICEVVGHMMVVSSTKKATLLLQDPGNAIGRLTDVVVKSLEKA